MNTLIVGTTGLDKTAGLQDYYFSLINKSERTDGIVVFVRNRRQSILWRNKIDSEVLTDIRIQTYFGFVQTELKKYWPIVRNKISDFKADMIEPNFLTIEALQFLLTEKIAKYRQAGKLVDITASDQSLAIEVGSILSQLAVNKRDIKDYKTEKQNLTIEIQDLILEHITDCKSNGMIDYYIAFDIYHKYLLPDNDYIKRLKDIKHIIVDGLEDSVACEIDFINLMLPNLESCMAAFYTDGTFLRRQGAVPEYAQAILFEKFQLLEDSSMDNLRVDDSLKINFEYTLLQSELRSDMIKDVYLNIIDMLQGEYLPSDIAVICPTVDNVMEFYLKSNLEKQGIAVTNIARTHRYIEKSFVRALVSLACLCHPQWNLNPSEYDIANLIAMILGLDPIRSGFIAKEVVKQKPFVLPDMELLHIRERIGFKNSKQYDFLKAWIEQYRIQQALSMGAFLQKAFSDLLISLPLAEENINTCKVLVESAVSFSAIHNDSGKNFIELVMQGIKPAETIQDLETRLYTNDVVLSTPQAYVASGMVRKVQIWTDISSVVWHKSDVTLLSNPYILSPIWGNRIWGGESDEMYKLKKLQSILNHLLDSKLQKLIIAHSQYNQDGYENSGILGCLL